MKCRICGCTDSQACEGRCWWAAPNLCSSCAKFPLKGELWRDHDGHARVCGTVLVEDVGYVVMLRTRGSGKHKRRPFLFPEASMLRGDDGWTHVPEAAHG